MRFVIALISFIISILLGVHSLINHTTTGITIMAFIVLLNFIFIYEW